MPKLPAEIPGIGLATLVYATTLLGVGLLSIGLVAFMQSYALTVTERAVDRAIQVRAHSAGLDLARAIEAEWQELRVVEEILPSLPPAELRGMLAGMVGSGDRVAWVGYAGLDGRVRVASGGLLEGQDVSERPWFRAGLEGGYAGDVRDAVLLNRLLGGTEQDPIRFLDLAVPVTDAEGAPVGVLASHIDAAWAERYLAESAEIRGIDLFVVNPAGEVVLATAPPPPDPSRLQSFRAAATGATTTVRETWDDGLTYQSSVIPTVTYGSLPSFGWRLVGRIPADAFAADRRDVLRVALTVMGGCLALVLLLAVAFVRLFVAPVTRISDAALAIAEGQDVYPPESRSSREAAALSVALARLQGHARSPAGR